MTCYWLSGPGTEFQWGRDFSLPEWSRGPHSLLVELVPVLSRGKTSGTWCWSSTKSGTVVKDRVQLYLYSPYWPLCPVLRKILYPAYWKIAKIYALLRRFRRFVFEFSFSFFDMYMSYAWGLLVKMWRQSDIRRDIRALHDVTSDISHEKQDFVTWHLHANAHPASRIS